MKKLLLTAILLVGSLFAEVTWVNYDDALKMAKKENKIVLVMLSREGCPACEYMDDIVFENDAVIDAMNKDFIGVHLDIHQDFVPDGLTYIGTPTFYFLNKHERKLERIDGGINAKKFADKLKEVKAAN